MGKFIVIEGTDGSGKATQTDLLVKRLSDQGHKMKTLDFPQYGNQSAFFVERYLNGHFGSLKDIDPKLVCLFFAMDRFSSKRDIRAWLDSGGNIVANRYVASNKGHQAGKASTHYEREDILRWINYIEHDLMGLPKEDLVIFLDVPPEVGQRLVHNKIARSYTSSSHDLHEKDINHLRKASEAYKYIAEKEGWKIINCLRKDSFTVEEMQTLPLNKLILSREEIHEQVFNAAIEILGTELLA